MARPGPDSAISCVPSGAETSLRKADRQTRVTGEAGQCSSMLVEGCRSLTPDLRASERLSGPPAPPGQACFQTWTPQSAVGTYEAFPRAAALGNLHTSVCGPLLGVPIFPAFVGGPGMGGGRGTSWPRFGYFMRTLRGRDVPRKADRQTRVTGEAGQCSSMLVEGCRSLTPDLRLSERLSGPPAPPGPGLDTTKCRWHV